MQKSSRKRLQTFHGQQGSSSLLLIAALLMASLLGLRLLQQRAEKEMRAAVHDDIKADKLKVKAALRSQGDCSAIDLNSSCTVGSSLALKDRAGNTLVTDDGQTLIGSWNTRIECRAKAVPEYWIMVARLDGNAGFRKDVLTGKPLGWTELMPLKEACSPMGVNTVLLKSPPCYGALEGNGALPNEIAAASSCLTAGCTYNNKYCTEPQRDFPECPEDHQVLFHYVDRYGWGGIDFNKYTICQKL